MSCILADMPKPTTTIRVSTPTRRIFKRLAKIRGQSVIVYLERLARAVEQGGWLHTTEPESSNTPANPAA